MRCCHLVLMPLLAVGLAGCARAPKSPAFFTIQVAGETDPVPSAEDAADDPAIWVNSASPEESRIVATDKKGGLVVYDLRGRTVQSLPGGRPNNVDLRAGFPFADGPGVLVMAEDRTDDTLAFWRLREATGTLEPLAGPRPQCGFHVYGSTLYRSARTGDFYAFVAENDLGRIRQYRLALNAAGGIDATQVRLLPVETESEGMAADDDLGHYYVSEERVGVWRFSAEPDGGTAGRLVLPMNSPAAAAAGLNLRPDMEGIAICRTGPTSGYVVVSAQGNNAYVVLDREGWNPFLGWFRTTESPFGDATQETDGLDVTAAPLGKRWSRGMLVVQDGENPGARQNFKMIGWAGVEEGLRSAGRRPGS